MSHFFVTSAQIAGDTLTILGDDVNHMKNVLRMRSGEAFTAADENGMFYRCEIDELDKVQVTAKILWKEEGSSELSSKIYLFQGLPKSDKMELIIQKAVELGAYEIVPVSTKRAIVKLDAKKEASKLKRWQAIAEGAAKQSGRMLVPQIHELMTFSEALQMAKTLDINVIPYECAKGMNGTREIFGSIKPGMSVGIFIGPEGGFEESEVEKAKEAGVHPVTLGKRILRTETAGLTTLSILMYLLEEE
ncbi:MAG: 16S rRNA (uracil(1498)-N(3))-methyltransferase [Lachnospiraceae bacterium]|nr:16S rRNA (uracil(1498)-N(3))-methyltransferase [Lachnospiraceae bacterium]